MSRFASRMRWIDEWLDRKGDDVSEEIVKVYESLVSRNPKECWHVSQEVAKSWTVQEYYVLNKTAPHLIGESSCGG